MRTPILSLSPRKGRLFCKKSPVSGRCSLEGILPALYQQCQGLPACYDERPLLLLAAFFSFCICFFCLFDFGFGFCTLFCSLLAIYPSCLITRFALTADEITSQYFYCIKFVCQGIGSMIGK